MHARRLDRDGVEFPLTVCRHMARLKRSGFLDQRLVPEDLPQFLQSESEACLDRTNRVAELIGDFCLGQPAEIGQLDRLSLLGRKLPQRVRDDP